MRRDNAGLHFDFSSLLSSVVPAMADPNAGYDVNTIIGLQRALGGAMAAEQIDPSLIEQVRGLVDPVWADAANKFGVVTLGSVADQFLNAGAFPRPASFAGQPVTNRPIWLQDPAKYAAWEQFVTQYRPLVLSVNSKQMDILAQQTAQLTQFIDQLNTAYRVTAAVATVGLSELIPAVQAAWDALQAKLARYNALKTAALALLANPKINPAQKAKVSAALNSGSSMIVSTLAKYQAQSPGIDQAIAPGGIGSPLEVFAALGTAAQLAIIAGVVAAVAYAIKQLEDAGVEAADFLTNYVGKTGEYFLGGLALVGIGWWLWRRYGKRRAPSALPSA